METFGLSNFERIQIMTKKKCYINGAFETCTNNLDIPDEIKNNLGFLCYVVNNLIPFFSIYRIQETSTNDKSPSSLCN